MLGATFLTNLVLLAGSFVAGLVTARVLGVEDRGALAACLTFGLLTSRVGVLGLDVALAARCGRGERPGRGVVGRAVAVSLAAGAGILAAGGALLLAGGRLTAEQAGALGPAVAGYALSGQVVEIATAVLVATGSFAAYNLSRLAYSGVLLAVLAAAAFSGRLSLEVAAAAYAAASILAAVCMAGAVTTVRGGPRESASPAGDGPPAAAPSAGLLATAAPFAAFNTLRSAEIHVPAITLALLGDNAALGLFAVAHSVAVTQLSLADAAGKVFFARAIAARADPERRGDLLAAWRRGVVRSLAVGLAVAVAGLLLIPVVYGPAFAAARWVCLGWALVLALVALNNMLEELIKGTDGRSRLLPHKLVQAAVLVACLAVAVPVAGGVAAVLGAVAVAALVALALNGRLVATGFLGRRPGALAPTAADAADLVAGLGQLAARRAAWLTQAYRSAFAKPAA